MSEIHAETAYLFRHALVRDAAYELQPLTDRGQLHALALQVLEEICGGTPQMTTPHWLSQFQPHPSDRFAMEMVEHADGAATSLQGDDARAAARKGAVYLFRSAVIEERGYRPKRALELFERLAEHPGADNYLRAHGYFSAGQVYYQFGNLDEASRRYNKMEQFVDRTNDPYGAHLLDSVRTVIESHTDNGPHIAETHQRTGEFWRKVGDRNRELSSLINFAVWHCEEGDHETARRSLRQAIELAREINSRRGEEAAMGTLALLNGNDGMTDDAVEGIGQAMKMARESHNNLAVAQWIVSLAEVQLHAGRLADAEANYREAVQFCRTHQMDAKLDYAEAYLAAVLIESGRMDEARPIWERAWKSLTSRNDDYTRKGVLKGLQLSLKRAGLAPATEDGRLP